MILADTEIFAELDAGNIVLSPYADAQLNGASYDLGLGDHYYRVEPQRAELPSFVGPFSADSLGGIWLDPGERVLAHTHEAAGSVGDIVPRLAATSTAARLGLQVCPGPAGWGDPGYTSRWTLELHNINPGCLFIPRRAIVCQIIFARLSSAAAQQYGKDQGRYQVPPERQWRPEDMLPPTKGFKICG